MRTQKEVKFKTQRVYDFVYDFISDNWYSPAIRDISTALDLRVSNVVFHLDRLVKSGHIIKEKNIARSIRIVGTVYILPDREKII